MFRHVVRIAVALTLCLAVSTLSAAQRGKEGGRSGGGKSAGREGNSGRGEAGRSNNAHGGAGGKNNASHGGAWSEKTHNSGSQNHGAAAGAAHKNNQKPQATSGQKAAAGEAAENRKTPQNAGAKGAAAGAAAENRNTPQNAGAKGAAAGAAAAKNNSPQVSGAAGAAAGAAAENRNSPKYSGAQGAAAGAAAANKNNPQFSGAQGAAAGAAAANRNSPQYSGAEGAVAGAAAVRNNFNHPGLYGNDWYGAHSGVWVAGGWAAGAAWTPSNWGAVSGYYGAASEPISYDYGNNVTYQDGNVSVNGQNVGTGEEYSQQAADLAATGAAAEASPSDDWLPLGVFAMVRNEQQHPHLTVQLAINKQGVLRGNFTDEVTDSSQPIQGAADPKTQRAAWTVGDNKASVMEAGLSNLASGEAPALIHKNGKTDHWLLIRLDQAGNEAKPADPAATEPATGN